MGASKRITIRDVAQRAGTSESTVSRVLNKTDTTISISEETRERVIRAAQELDYQPHPLAQALRGKGTHLLGVIVREIDDPFFIELIETISNEATERGYDLVLGYARSDPQQALELSEILDLRHCDGLFLLGDLKESPDDRTFLKKMAERYLVVSVCRGSGELVNDTVSVSCDNRKGAFAALSYLHKLGHHRIAFVDGSRLADIGERKEAYLEFMASRCGSSCREYIQSDENSYQGGYRATKRLLSLPETPTAIFASDDGMAVGVLKAASDMGYRVPRDVSVIGFDDIKIAAYLQPSLTTVRQPIESIGRQAVDLMLKMVEAKSVPALVPHILMEPELIVRGSCAPPSQPQSET
jgi:LacI family repressor for deo operon, udp, cdd, tsx, nupC, and nupG